MAKNTCRDCNRNVVMVRIGGNLVATDPELIMVVPARERTPSPRAEQSGIVMASRQTFARRVHAERCADYKEQDRRDRLSAEMREYNRKHGGAGKASRNRNRGL